MSDLDVRDLRLELRTRNNVLWHAIFDHYPSVAACARALSLCQGQIGAYLNLKKTPWRRPGEAIPAARRIATAFGYLEEDLFPPLLYERFDGRRGIAELDVAWAPLTAARDCPALEASPEALAQEAEGRATLLDVLQSLSPREEALLKMRYGLTDRGECNIDEIAASFGVRPARLRQIEAKALRRLRHPTKAKRLRAAYEVSA